MGASRSLMIESDSKDSYGPEGSREENATNPTTAGLPTGSGVVQAPPTSRHTRGFGASAGKAIFARAIRAPDAVREASLVGIQPGPIEAKPRAPEFHMCPCSGWVTPSTDLVDAMTRSSGHRLASAFILPSPRRRRYAPEPDPLFARPISWPNLL